MNRRSGKRRQHGLTLIEMMVSVALGLLILAAVLQLFTASRQSYRFQQNVARMQENARIAVEILQRTVRDAGFEPPPQSGNQLTCATAAACLLGGSNDLTASQATTAAAMAGSDTLIVRVRSDGNATDCQGETLPYNIISGASYTNSSGNNVNTSNEFRIGPTTPTATTPPSLRCGQSSASPSGGVWGQPLVDDIEDMQVLYGLRNGSTGSLIYVPGSALTTAQFNLLTAVRVQLCVRSPDANVVTAAQTQHCVMDSDGDGTNDDDRTTGTLASDGRLRQVITTTIKLRNRL